VGKCSRRLVLVALAGAVMLSVQFSAVTAARPPAGESGGVLPSIRHWPLKQPTDWVRAKRAHQVRRIHGAGTVIAPIAPGARRISAPPASLTLPSKVTAQFIEPLGVGQDDSGKRYVDVNYWNICAAGAATAAAAYFLDDPTDLSGTFREPYGPFAISTQWDAADTDSVGGFRAQARAYMLYMAEAVKPPSFDRPGIDNFDTYPTLGGAPQSVRDALNWELSSHNKGGHWATYFYFIQENSGPAFSPNRMNADIVADIAGSGAAVIANVDADYLPNWPDLAKPLHHAIVIIGYDNDADTYTYLDTCGRLCGSKTDGGTHVISQAKLFKAVQMVGRVDSDGYLIAKADGTPRYPIGAYIW
jgi:hypothetical protein